MMQNTSRCKPAIKHTNSNGSMCSAEILDDLPRLVGSELEIMAGRPSFRYDDLAQTVAKYHVKDFQELGEVVRAIFEA
jgi:hypothetical protein